MSRKLAEVSSDRRLPARREAGSFRSVPSIRSENHFRVSTPRVWPLVVAIVVLVLVGGGAFLILFQPRPPLQHFEVTVPNDRFAR